MNHPSEEQLNEYLDRESQQREQIESHLSSCSECATRLAVMQALFAEWIHYPNRHFHGISLHRSCYG